MRRVFVVLVEILSEDRFELTPREEQHPVEALPAEGAHEALGDGSARSGGRSVGRATWRRRTVTS